MKFTDKVFAVLIPCNSITYEYDQAFLVDILQEIEKADPRARWEGSTSTSAIQYPTQYVQTQGSSTLDYLVYSATTNRLIILEYIHIDRHFSDAEYYAKCSKSVFLNQIKSYLPVVAQVSIGQNAGSTTSSASPNLGIGMGSAGNVTAGSFSGLFSTPTTNYDYVIGDVHNMDKAILMKVLQDVENIDPSILWKNGGYKPTNLYRTHVGFIVCRYIIYNSGTNELSNSMDPPPIPYDLCSTKEFIQEIQKCRIPMNQLQLSNKVPGAFSTEVITDSKWNCKCSSCKQDAYDNGMSFECSNGCKQATGVFLVK